MSLVGSKLFFKNDAKKNKKKNVKKIGQFSGIHISQTVGPIFFKFSM